MQTLDILMAAEESIRTGSYRHDFWQHCACGHIAGAAGVRRRIKHPEAHTPYAEALKLALTANGARPGFSRGRAVRFSAVVQVTAEDAGISTRDAALRLLDAAITKAWSEEPPTRALTPSPRERVEV